MRRVLIPTLESPEARGGIGRYIHAIAKTFPIALRVFVWNNTPTYAQMLGVFWRGRREYDVLWVHHILPVGTAAYAFARLTGKPYVIFLHGMDFDLARANTRRRYTAKHILRNAEAIVVNSKALGREVKEFCGRECLVVYPCVSDDLLNTANQDSPSRPRAQREGEISHPRDAQVRDGNIVLRLLTVARLVQRKGHEKILRAMCEVPNTLYDIVGDGPEQEKIEKTIIDLGLEQRVQIHPDVSDDSVADFYRSADIFVMPATRTPYDREGFGTVYIEAGLFGLPVIAAATPGVDEAIRDGETGLLVSDDHDALVFALSRLVGDVELRKAMGEQGRDRVRREFTRESQMSKLGGLL